MKAAVINSSELDSHCWNPKRFLNNCEECGYITACYNNKKRNIKEAKIGMVNSKRKKAAVNLETSQDLLRKRVDLLQEADEIERGL